MTARPDGVRTLARYLRRHGVQARIERAPGATPTAEAAARALGVPLASVVKTLLLTDGQGYAAAVVAGTRRIDRARVGAAAGLGPLRFATAQEVLEQTGYPPGGVAPLAFLRQPRVVVDEELLAEPGSVVVAGGGREDLLLRVRASDIAILNGARVARISRSNPDEL